MNNSLPLLSLKIKVILQAKKKKKTVYLRTAKNCNLGQAIYSKSHRQIQQTKERKVISWRKRGS